MSNERRLRLWGLVVEQAHGDPVAVAHVGTAALGAVGVDGAAITVTLSATPRETVYASDPTASELEDGTATAELGRSSSRSVLYGSSGIRSDPSGSVRCRTGPCR
jgi:hypothetical protein